MRPGGGRGKGNGYENKIAKKVILAFACFGMKRVDCYRTPGSGGHRFAHKKDPGDLVLSSRMRKLFPFSVECKFYRKVKLWPLWIPIEDQKRAHKFRLWLRQAKAAAGEKKIPLLVFKENNGPDMVMFPMKAWSDTFPQISLKGPRLITQWTNANWIVVLLEDLLIALVESEKRRRKNASQ